MKTKLFTLFAAVFAVLLLVGCESTKQEPVEEQPVVQEEVPAPVVSEGKKETQAYFTKTPYFEADSSVFENEAGIDSWFDSKTKELLKLAESQKVGKKLENIRFEVRGYCAVFPNDIDEKVLTRERAQVVAKKLQECGIPASNITVIPEGATRRWSNTDRRENRIATITVIVITE